MENLKTWFADKLKNLQIQDGVLDKSSLLLVFGKIRADISARMYTLNLEFIANRNLYFGKNDEKYRKTIRDYLAKQRQLVDDMCKETLASYKITQ